jgi:hypothetical protein
MFPEVPGSIPGADRFYEQQWVGNGVHSAPVRLSEMLLERKAAAVFWDVAVWFL